MREPVVAAKRYIAIIVRKDWLRDAAWQAWDAKAFAKFMANKVGHQRLQVRRPLTAALAIAKEMGWSMLMPDTVQGHTCVQWKVQQAGSAASDAHKFVSRMQQHIDWQECQRAAQGRQGFGMQKGGADLTQVFVLRDRWQQQCLKQWSLMTFGLRTARAQPYPLEETGECRHAGHRKHKIMCLALWSLMYF